LIKAVGAFEKKQDAFDPRKIQSHAELFSEKRFKREFKEFVDQKTKDFYESHR
jgi:hypothetical protein